MQVRLCFSTVCDFFVCLCIIYLENGWTDLRQIHREDMFGPTHRRVWLSRSKVKVMRDKKRKTAESSPLTMHSKACAVGRMLHTAADDTTASQPGGSRGDGSTCWWRIACSVRFGTAFIALVYFFLPSVLWHGWASGRALGPWKIQW